MLISFYQQQTRFGFVLEIAAEHGKLIQFIVLLTEKYLMTLKVI